MKRTLLIITHLLALGMGIFLSRSQRSIQTITTSHVAPAPPALAGTLGAAPGPGPTPGTNTTSPFSWNSIESSDYVKYIQNLRSIGCPEQTIRDIIITDINKLYAKRLAALRPTWKPTDPQPSIGDVRLYNLERERTALLRERNDLIVRLLGPEAATDLEEIAGKPTWFDTRYSFVAPEKRQALIDLEERYRHLENAISVNARGFSTPQDALERQRLQDEFNQEVAKLLTPRELALFNARNSGLMNLVDLKRRFDASEDEVAAIYTYEAGLRQIQQASASDPDAQKSIAEQLKASLGPERYEKYVLFKDPTYKDFFNLAARFELPAQTADTLIGIKRTAEAERDRLIAEGNSAQLQDLQNRTASQVQQVLGPDKFQIYQRQAPSAGWIQRLGNIPK